MNDGYENITLKEYIFEKYIRKIFYVFFISNSVNLDNVVFDEISKRQNFINNLSFSKWFDLYGRHTLNKKKRELIMIVKYFFFFFIIINILIFTPFIYSELKKGKYPKQNALLISSHLITRMYILPLSKTLGYRNIVILPFYAIRNFLYNKGISMLPENAPEREVWWYNTRFLEYAAVVDPTISKWFSEHKKPFTKREIDDIDRWNNEVYSHILKFAEIDLSSTVYKNNHLQIYRDMIDKYQDSTSTFSITQQIVTPYWLIERERTHRKKYPGPKYDAVKHNLELIDKFDKLKEKLKSENSSAYIKYEQEPVVEEYIMKKHLTQNYLEYKETFDKIDCASKELLIFKNMEFNILNYIIENGNKINPQKLFLYRLSLMTAIDYQVCPLLEKEINANFKRLDEFYKERNKTYSKKRSRRKYTK